MGAEETELDSVTCVGILENPVKHQFRSLKANEVVMFSVLL